MDQRKTGELIRSARRACGMTQMQLAECLGVSDKAVSKWERGAGCPDLSTLPLLTEVLGIDTESLLRGEAVTCESGGNMKKLRFYVCEQCGAITTSSGDSSVSCCGRRLSALEPQKAQEDERLCVELIENDYYITADHEMTREHYISFVALVTGDALILRKQYPEWDLSVRLPRLARGRLVWYCTRHGLRYQLV